MFTNRMIVKFYGALGGFPFEIPFLSQEVGNIITITKLDLDGRYLVSILCTDGLRQISAILKEDFYFRNLASHIKREIPIS